MADPSLAGGAGPDEIRHPELPSTVTSSHFVDFWSGRNSRVPWNRSRPVKPAPIFYILYQKLAFAELHARGRYGRPLISRRPALVVLSGASLGRRGLSDIRQPDRRRGRSDRLGGLGYAVVVGFGRPPGVDRGGPCRDPIGL